MEQLKQILLKKAKIIGELKYPQRNNRQATLKYFKKIKKQERQNKTRQKQILQSLFQAKYQEKEDLEKVYFLSFTIMKGFSKKFQFIPEQKDIFGNIVEMNYNFYLKQQAIQKAEQIKSIYRKKLYQKQFFLPTLLSWIYEWGRKKLSKFIQTNVQSIQKDLIIDRIQSPSKPLQNYQSQICVQSPTHKFSVDTVLKKVSLSERIDRDDKQKPNLKIIINGSDQILQRQSQNKYLSPFSLNINSILPEQQTQYPSYSIQKTFQSQKNDQTIAKNIYVQNRSKSYNGNYRQKTLISLNINKEIFYGTYWKQMNIMYKNLNCIDDLDCYYLKTFKKQKEQVKQEILDTKMDQLVQSLVKNMPKVKKSIQNYEKQYSKYCPQKIKTYHSVLKISITQSRQLRNTQNINQKHHKHSHKLSHLRYSISKSQNDCTYSEKQKLQDEIKQQIFKSKAIKQNVINKILQRNLSYNDTMARKYMQQKTQKQVKLPIVYNPQNLCHQREDDAEKALMIHQKFQKFITNCGRPSKGLARYKLLNKEKQRSNMENLEFCTENITHHIDMGRQQEYEVANIRKILKKRQKQRFYVNKTPLIQSQIQQPEAQRSIMQIKVIQMQKRSDEQSLQKKSQRYEVFLSNLKSTTTPYRMKSNSKSFNFGSLKSADLGVRNIFKCERQDFLPKLT